MLMPRLGPFVGERLGQLGDAALAGGVGRHGVAAEERQQRGDVDDLAVALVEHDAAGHLAQGEHGGQVDLDHRRPVVERKRFALVAALDAGGIHQDVQPAAELFQRPVESVAARRIVGEIDGEPVAAKTARSGTPRQPWLHSRPSRRRRLPRPAPCSASAMPWPRPRVAPVTMALRSATSNSVIGLSLGWVSGRSRP